MQSYTNPFISNLWKVHNWPKLLSLSTPKLIETGFSSTARANSIRKE
jgi:hypothetical protein